VRRPRATEEYPKTVRTPAYRPLAAPGAVLQAEPPGEAVELVIAVALVEGRGTVIRHVGRKGVATVLNVFGLAAVDVCR
jgi:hypothetical protein